MSRNIQFAFVALLASMVFAERSPGAEGRQYVYSGHVRFQDLPAELEGLVPQEAKPGDVQELTSGRPDLVLDGAILEISPPDRGSTRSLLLGRLELRNQARIVIRNVNLEIVAESIKSEGGEFISFPAEAKVPPAPPGQNGESGLAAGALLLDSPLESGSLLHVLLPGAAGQDGGQGLPGPQGAAGPRGDNGADHLFDCAHGGGNGGPGSGGGPGGNGAQGGAGGQGGQLVLRGGIAAQRVQIDFAAPGGKGGAGGLPGPGGPGGLGGQGGSGSTYCRGGNAGPRGPQGFPGMPGLPGPDGSPGRISVAD
jgi:hypothetical protein